MQVQHGSRASTTLDAVRALAAFVVLIGHARNLFVVDYPELLAAGGRPSAPLYGFYFVTSLGHQAVLVFFVLSGFFIGQAVLSRHAPGSRWSWSHYLVDRVSRLYVVLLPALALTLLWDHLGATAMPSLYDGSYPANILNFAADTRHDAATFLANATFLQTITAPPLGTNGALWSLANELWYYLLFPLALRVAVTRNQRERYLCLALFAGAATLVGSEILLYFPVWLLGVALNLLPIPRLAPRTRAVLPWAGGLAVLGALLLTRLRPGLLADYVLAVAVFGWMYGAVAAPRADAVASSRGARLAVSAAAFSYTLYAVHVPFIVALRAFIGAAPGEPLRRAPDAMALALLGGVTTAAIVFAWLVSRLTEARTSSVRRALRELFRLRPAAAPARRP
ncbi:MAG: acyltransferase [Myxococcales bacterium]|nr:acyltransferase [Myxococcales bacterium]